MDISKEYILQCEKAEKIQKQKPENKVGSNEFFGAWSLGDKQIWLPRQDQLHLLSKLSWQKFDWECANQYPLAITKEQAGIQVVMSQFKKEWKDNKWVDKTTQ